MITKIKHVNTLGLFGVVLAAGLVFTQSAFTPAKSGKALIYGYDQTHPENPWVLEGTEGYSCISSEEVCKYSFETPPTPDTTPDQGTPIAGQKGSYLAEER